MSSDSTRCEWVGSDPLMIAYHDKEWGVPVHYDATLFEFLILEGAQAGLSWTTILRKRENYKKAFDNFNITKIAKYDADKIKKLLDNPGIVRNKLKINAAIQNARTVLAIQKEFGSLDAYIWQFVNDKTIKHSYQSLSEYPAKTTEAEIISKDLLKRGCKFVGPTICYAFMQAVGMANDHQTKCFRYNQV